MYLFKCIPSPFFKLQFIMWSKESKRCLVPVKWGTIEQPLNMGDLVLGISYT